MKVRIESEGLNTKVMNAITGEEIQNVRSVRWEHEARDIPSAVIELITPEISIETEATFEQEGDYIPGQQVYVDFHGRLKRKGIVIFKREDTEEDVYDVYLPHTGQAMDFDEERLSPIPK